MSCENVAPLPFLSALILLMAVLIHLVPHPLLPPATHTHISPSQSLPLAPPTPYSPYSTPLPYPPCTPPHPPLFLPTALHPLSLCPRPFLCWTFPFPKWGEGKWGNHSIPVTVPSRASAFPFSMSPFQNPFPFTLPSPPTPLAPSSLPLPSPLPHPHPDPSLPHPRPGSAGPGGLQASPLHCQKNILSWAQRIAGLPPPQCQKIVLV